MGDYEPVDTGCRRAAVAKEGPALGVGPLSLLRGVSNHPNHRHCTNHSRFDLRARLCYSIAMDRLAPTPLPRRSASSGAGELFHFRSKSVSNAPIRVSEALQSLPKNLKPQIGNGTKWNRTEHFSGAPPAHRLRSDLGSAAPPAGCTIRASLWTRRIP